MSSGKELLENRSESLPLQNSTSLNVSSNLGIDTIFFETDGILKVSKYTNEVSTDTSPASPSDKMCSGSASTSTLSWSRPLEIDNSDQEA